MSNNNLAATSPLTNELSHQGKRYYFTDLIGQQSTKLVGLITYSGKYSTYPELIHEIADKFNICVGETAQHVFFVTSKEDYDNMLKELDEILK